MPGFQLLAARGQEAMPMAPYHAWPAAQDEPWTAFFRTDSGYLLRFPGLADFEIAGAALAVTCQPAPAISMDTCEHLYLNQVLPLVMSGQGKLVFHASAVDLSGVAVAFLAESGRGKSTLAASFATCGQGFLTDDGLVVESRAAGYWVLPSQPAIRLWEDSRKAMVSSDAAAAPGAQDGAKARILAGNALAFCAQARPLRRAYFLGDGRAAGISFERLPRAEAMMQWVRNSFLLDPKEHSLLGAHFQRVAELANRVDCYRLDYPRRYEGLARVRQAIADHLQEEGVAA